MQMDALFLEWRISQLMWLYATETILKSISGFLNALRITLLPHPLHTAYLTVHYNIPWIILRRQKGDLTELIFILVLQN